MDAEAAKKNARRRKSKKDRLIERAAVLFRCADIGRDLASSPEVAS